GLLPLERALDLSLRMPDLFLADTSAELDPRQAEALVAGMPADRVIAIATVLVSRGDFVTLARFVDFLAPETIRGVIDSTADELALLHIATYVDSKPKLTELLGLIPRDRLRTMIAAVSAQGGELWLEALALTTHLNAQWKQVIGDLAAELDTSVLASMLATARVHAAWDAVLPLVVAMSDW